jgi:hypothetical protein
MPTNIAGIQGLNPWNALLFFIFLAWLATRWREGLTWDMPPDRPLLATRLQGMVPVAVT